MQSPTMLTSSRLMSAESGSEQLKQIAMISPLVKHHRAINTTMELNSNDNSGNHSAFTQKVNRVCDEQSNVVNSTFTQEFNRADDERGNVVNSTFMEELNSVDDQISHIANSTFEQDEDKTQTNSESDSSFDTTTDQRVSTDLYDGSDSSANTVSYERDSDATFQQQASKQVSFLNYILILKSMKSSTEVFLEA